MSENINKMLNEMLEEQGKTDKINEDRLNTVIAKIAEIDSRISRSIWTSRLYKVAMNTKMYRENRKLQNVFHKDIRQNVEDAREEYLDGKIIGGKPTDASEQQIKDAEK